MASKEQIASEIKRECDKIVNEYFDTESSYVSEIKQIVTVEFQQKTSERNDWSKIILDYINIEEEHRKIILNKIMNNVMPLDYPGHHLGYKFHLRNYIHDIINTTNTHDDDDYYDNLFYDINKRRLYNLLTKILTYGEI